MPFMLVGLLLLGASIVWSLVRLRVDVERLRARVNLLNEEAVAHRRRLEELEHAARMSEVALVGRCTRQILDEAGYALLPDGALLNTRDEPRPSAWERLKADDDPKDPSP